MKRWALLLGIAACFAIAAVAQDASAPPADPSAANSSTPAAQVEPNSSDNGSQQQSDQDKPGTLTRLKRHLRKQISDGCVNGTHCWNRPPEYPDEQQKPTQTAQQRPSSSGESAAPPANPAPPRSDRNEGTSSSKQTKIDLSPPPGEYGSAPGREDEDVKELQPWDPHRAMKDIEVGDYYFRQKNYRASISRYREALHWKPRDAEATFKLAQALDRAGDFGESRKFYQEYLQILPKGEYAEQAQKSLDRLDNPTEAKRK